MRLVALELEEFRGWVRPQRINLDAAVVVVSGANGTGKTSLFDAILWALTGAIPRLGNEHKGDVVSLYGESGNARVRVELRSASGEILALTRSTNGERTRLQVESAQGATSDEEASLVLLRTLWPNGVGTTGLGGMALALSRAVYLQQDDVRRFIEADTDAERFSAVAELVGAGRYTDLQRQLERERAAWSKQTNELRDEASKAERQNAQLAVQIETLSAETGPPEEWTGWRDAVRDVLEDRSVLPDEAEVSQASEAVDAAVRRLEQAARASRRRADRAGQLRLDVEAALSIDAPTPEVLQQVEFEAKASDMEVAGLQEQLALAEHAAAAERDRLITEESSQREVQTLASLALRHLGERCPVCNQTYEIEATRDRLRRLASAGPAVQATEAADQVRQVSEQLARADRDRSSFSARLSTMRRLVGDRADALARAGTALRELELDVSPADASPILLALEESENLKASRVTDLIRRGEALALQLAQLGEAGRRSQLQSSFESAQADVRTRLDEIKARDATSDRATQVIDGLRAASDDLVAQRLTSLGPVLDRIYARIDPHPSFRSLQLVSRTWHGRGRLRAEIADEEYGIRHETPEVILSSSQLNAVALSIFLTLSLGVDSPPLDAILLDDPLQSLDEVNLLGVVDLLRRCKAKRQLVISTHDRRFAALLQRKLRSTSATEPPVAAVRLSDWSRGGPIVHELITESEESPWRIVANA